MTLPSTETAPTGEPGRIALYAPEFEIGRAHV